MFRSGGDRLRATAVVSVLAAVAASVVVPGLRGNAPEATVVLVERVAHAASGLAWVALVFAAVTGASEVARGSRIPTAARLLTVSGSGAVVALLLLAFRGRLPTPLALVLVGATTCVAAGGAAAGARAPHTRAVAVIVSLLTISALGRVIAWEVAYVAGERANPALYGGARALATFAVVVEACAQFVATAWLGTRSRLAQLGVLVAVAGAFVLTWGAAHGTSVGAPVWEAIAHTAFADAPGVPAPYGLAAVATFLAPSALLLALVASAQPALPAAVAGALALALLARAGFDVPARALAATAAGLWLALTAADERATGGTFRAAGPPREAVPARET